jgi:hypothetical protein
MLTHLIRDEFLGDYWDYEPGEHVVFAQPTGGGKTQWMYQLLQATMAQLGDQLSYRVTIPKRRDELAARWNAALGLREVPRWPPAATLRRRPPGWALWPRHLSAQPDQDPDVILARDRAHIERQLKACAIDAYQGGSSVLVADDIYKQAVILNMNELFSEILTDGRSMDCGLWGANTKPSGTKDGSVTSFLWNQPTHYFFGKDTDKRNRDRFGEIGGVDPRFVSEIVQGLQVHRIGRNNISDQLYISKAGSDGDGGPAMCIIGP